MRCQSPSDVTDDIGSGNVEGISEVKLGELGNFLGRDLRKKAKSGIRSEEDRSWQWRRTGELGQG